MEDFEESPIERESERAPRPKRSSHLNWEMLAIWSFVVFSFGGLPFCGYNIFATGLSNFTQTLQADSGGNTLPSSRRTSRPISYS